jgi:hypothetical protein
VKTIVIWDELEANLEFFVVDGDVSHLDGVYINHAGAKPELIDELSDLVYDQEGNPLVEFLVEFPTDIKNNFKVITAGFLP